MRRLSIRHSTRNRINYIYLFILFGLFSVVLIRCFLIRIQFFSCYVAVLGVVDRGECTRVPLPLHWKSSDILQHFQIRLQHFPIE